MPNCSRFSPSWPARSARCWISSDLLEKIPNLISRLTNFTVFSVYLLDEQREELSIAYAVGYPEEIVKHFTLKVGQGTVGTAVAEQRPILLNDVDQDPRYLAVVPGREVAARGAAAQQGPGDRRAQPAERQARRVHRARRVDPAAVRRARRAGDRHGAAVRVGARIRGDARDAGGDRPRDERDSRSRRAADEARAPDQARHRLPHLRHRAARRRDADARAEGHDQVRRRSARDGSR